MVHVVDEKDPRPILGPYHFTIPYTLLKSTETALYPFCRMCQCYVPREIMPTDLSGIPKDSSGFRVVTPLGCVHFAAKRISIP